MILELFRWIESVAPQCQPPYLEVGSRQVQGPGADLRRLFGKPYIGLDLEEGDGVDVVADFECVGWPGEPVNTVICTETLEHLKDPQRAVQRLYDALMPGGTAIITVPFAWFSHGFPEDYWRIAPGGMEELMKRAGFEDVVVMFGGTPLKVRWDEGRNPDEGSFSTVVWSHTLCTGRKGHCDNGH